MADQGLEKAVQLAREGNTQEAHQLFGQIVEADAHNVPAWLWYAKTARSAAERQQILQDSLRSNPDDHKVREILGLEKGSTAQPHRAAPLPPSSFAASMQPAPPTVKAQPGKKRRDMALVGISAALLVIFIIAALVLLNRSLPADPGKYRHMGAVEYYLYVPRGYTDDREWPLFVGIHGSGGSGLDCWNWWQRYAEREGFILLCPSLADSGGGWFQDVGEQKVFSVINEVGSAYRLSPQEFLAGFSAGAQFVQGFAFKYPQYVSGVAVLSAGNYYPPNYARNLPMLVVIGDRDDPGAVRTASNFSGTLQQRGFDVQYVVLPGIGHALTDQAQDLTIQLWRRTQGR
jgi:predicted esterase